jgi:lipoate---protein ligase
LVIWEGKVVGNEAPDTANTTGNKGADIWRVLPFSDAPMGRQLALSEALLAGLAESHRPALRWYVPRTEALVIGNGQKPRIANFETAAERDIDIYRRTSGGTAVFVNADLLSLDVALPATHPLATSDVVDAYRWMGEVWQQALVTLGAVKARALPVEEARKQPTLAHDDPLRLACYGTLSPWEVVVGKRKLVGLCQVRRRPGALYQIGIYRHFVPRALGELLDLGNNQRKNLATRLHNATVGLDDVAGRDVSADEIVQAFETTLTDRFGATLQPSRWTAAELRDADRLERERFQPFVVG